MDEDLSGFKPDKAGELFRKIASVGSAAAGEIWENVKDEVQSQLELISRISLQVAESLAKGEVTEQQAKHTLHLLELNLQATMLLIEILPFTIAEAILNAIFKVVSAVVKNHTGVDIDLGE